MGRWIWGARPIRRVAMVLLELLSPILLEGRNMWVVCTLYEVMSFLPGLG